MIQEVTMYAATCDNCGRDWENDTYGWSALTDRSSMRDTLIDDEWHIGDGVEGEEGKTYCPNCFGLDDDDKFYLKSVKK